MDADPLEHPFPGNRLMRSLPIVFGVLIKKKTLEVTPAESRGKVTSVNHGMGWDEKIGMDMIVP